MEVLLLGTGSADGWPNPFCGCASCLAAAAAGVVRGQTAALVDGTLLLDCGPETPRAALRAGRTLAGVRHLLLTHAHPDHAAPAALLWRSWAARREPLDVVGPGPVVASWRAWIGPRDPVVLREVRAGDRLRLGAHDVRVLPAAHGDQSTGPALLYDVTGPDGRRLLYGTDTGPLPEPAVAAAAGAAYDVVLLEETFGDWVSHGTDHLDLATFPRELRRLRQVGALTAATDVVAVHLSHRNPPPDELGRLLGRWGARAVPDGTSVVVPERPSHDHVPRRDRDTPMPLGTSTAHDHGWSAPRRTLLLGGARSGKSAEAERRLAAEPSVTYVATGVRPNDPEWAARVAAHRTRRPPWWRTVETTRVAPILREQQGPVLLDCLTLWLTAVLEECGGWEGVPGWDSAVAERVDELVAAWRATEATVVAVSNEVGSGVVPATPAGRRFRDELGRLNARVAAESDEVALVVAGQVLTLRGGIGSRR
jgi:adenosylcobinamide kinase / adenosylcobinamide-phosphate guanylyltransferase